MGLLDGGLAGVFSAALAPLYLDAALHRAILTDDGKGGGSESFVANEACKAQLDKTIERMIDGQMETLQSILMLQTVTRPSPDDEITLDGTRWQIATIETDPANAYFLLGGRKASGVLS